MPIKLGGTDIADIRLGTSAVTKVYKGGDEVWPGTQPPEPPSLPPLPAGAIAHYYTAWPTFLRNSVNAVPSVGEAVHQILPTNGVGPTMVIVPGQEAKAHILRQQTDGTYYLQGTQPIQTPVANQNLYTSATYPVTLSQKNYGWVVFRTTNRVTLPQVTFAASIREPFVSNSRICGAESVAQTDPPRVNVIAAGVYREVTLVDYQTRPTVYAGGGINPATAFTQRAYGRMDGLFLNWGTSETALQDTDMKNVFNLLSTDQNWYEAGFCYSGNVTQSGIDAISDDRRALYPTY